MTIRSAWHMNSTQTREDTRLAPIGTVTVGELGDLSSLGGVIPGPNNPMALNSTGTMSGQVEVGRAVVQGSASQGSYPVVITTPEPVSFTDGDAVNDRIDTVAIVIRDDAYDSTGFTDIRCIVVEGTPETTPSAPVMPTTSCLPLFDVLVGAGVSAGTGGIPWSTAITDRRTYISALGGITVGEVAGAIAGQYRDTGGSGGTLQRYNGTNWDGWLQVGDPGGLRIGGDVTLSRSGTSALQVRDKVRILTTTQDGSWGFQVSSYWTSRPLFQVDDQGVVSLNTGNSFDDKTVTLTKTDGATELVCSGAFRSAVGESVSNPVMSAGWSLNSFRGRKTNGVIEVTAYVQRTGAALGGDLNVSDTDICTLPAGFRPVDQYEALGSDGYGNGAILIYSSGLMRLRSWSANTVIDTGANIRISATYLAP